MGIKNKLGKEYFTIPNYEEYGVVTAETPKSFNGETLLYVTDKSGKGVFSELTEEGEVKILVDDNVNLEKLADMMYIVQKESSQAIKGIYQNSEETQPYTEDEIVYMVEGVSEAGEPRPFNEQIPNHDKIVAVLENMGCGHFDEENKVNEHGEYFLYDIQEDVTKQINKYEEELVSRKIMKTKSEQTLKEKNETKTNKNQKSHNTNGGSFANTQKPILKP